MSYNIKNFKPRLCITELLCCMVAISMPYYRKICYTDRHVSFIAIGKKAGFL